MSIQYKKEHKNLAHINGIKKLSTSYQRLKKSEIFQSVIFIFHEMANVEM